MPSKPETYKLDQTQFIELKNRVQTKLIAELDPQVDISSKAVLRAQIEELFTLILSEMNIVLSRAQRARLFETIIADILGFGPIEFLLSDGQVLEILAVGYNKVYIDRGSGYALSDIQFDNNDHLLRIIDRIVAPLGKRCRESDPITSTYLPDGSHCTAILTPVTLSGSILHIRKSTKRFPPREDELIRRKIISEEAMNFLTASVQAGLNILVTGQQNCGKSTLLSVLASQIPDENLAVVIDSKVTLLIEHEKTIFLTDREANIDGYGAISVIDLIRTADKMRPNTLIVDDIGGEELLALNQSPSHWMGCATIRGFETALFELGMQCQIQQPEFPDTLIQKLIAHHIDVLVYLDKAKDIHRVTHIAKLTENYEFSDIFAFSPSTDQLQRVTKT